MMICVRADARIFASTEVARPAGAKDGGKRASNQEVVRNNN